MPAPLQSVSDWVQEPLVLVVLAIATLAGCAVGFFGVMDARRSSKRAAAAQKRMVEQVQTTVVQAVQAVMTNRPPGIDVASEARSPKLPQGQPLVITAAKHLRNPTDVVGTGRDRPQDYTLPPGVEAAGEFNTPLGRGRPLFLVQNQRAGFAELLVLRWDGFDLLLEGRDVNATGASYEIVASNDTSVTLETLDLAVESGLNRYEITWDGRLFARAAAGPLTRDVALFFTVPSWAAPTSPSRK